MKKKSLLMAAVLMFGVVGTTTESLKAMDTSNIESKLDFDNVKTSEILPSILKPGEPENFYLNIDGIKDALSEISMDYEKNVKLPSNVVVKEGDKESELSGDIYKGVGVSIYKLNKDELRQKKFVPNNENLLSDSKYSITNTSGKFSLGFDSSSLRKGDYIGICVSYSYKDKSNKDINKTYVVSIPVEIQDNINDKDSNEVYHKLDSDSVKKNNSNIDRIYGKNRFETNVETIRRGFDNKSKERVVITNGDSFADSLAAGPLAIKYKAPVLFSNRSSLRKSGIEELKKLRPKEVILIGGENTLDENVEKQIKRIDKNVSIKRIGGKNRFKTSQIISSYFDNSRNVVVVDGRNFADALSATPLAKKINAPIILVRNIGSVPSDISRFSKAYIVGGNNSVSMGIEGSLKNAIGSGNVYRLEGKNRFETSVKVSDLIKYNNNIIANGNSFADALSSVNLLVNKGSNLLLVGKNHSVDNVLQLINSKPGVIVGGYNTVENYIK